MFGCSIRKFVEITVPSPIPLESKQKMAMIYLLSQSLAIIGK